MATSIKISQLPQLTTPTTSSFTVMVDNGITHYITAGTLKTAFTSNLATTSSVSIVSASAGGAFQSASSYSSSIATKINTFATTGSNTFAGDETISGSLFISGTTEFGGNLVPKTARGATLGTSAKPFSEIFLSSGSLNIASDTPGAPNTSLSNVSGNILISAGGMQLVGTGSFNAVTASFGYLSGSFTHKGTQFNDGDIVTTGSLSVSGSTIMIGNNTMTGSLNVSGSIIGTDKIIIGNLNGDANNIVVAGTNYTSQVTIGAYGTDYVGQLMLHRHSTEIQPIIVAARSNTDTDVDGDVTPGMPLLQIAATGWAGNDYKEFANIVFSADDLDGITIGDGSSPGKIDFNVTPDGDIHTNTALSLRSNLDAEFNGLVKSNGIILGADYPTTSKGKVGDLNGMIASDGNYIYYCYQDYSDGTNNIWKRVQLSNASW